jgi:glucose-1-phosphate thymidylyltransferase
MKGLILAAGVGSRLRPVTNHVPKPMLPIANKPTIHYSIELLRSAGVDDICVVTGHLADRLEQALGNGDQLHVHLSYRRQPEPKGLAHAVVCAADFISGEPFILLLGDTMYDMSLQGLRERFECTEPDCLALVAPVSDPSRYGIAVLQEDRIIDLEEKPKDPKSNLAMAGIYLFGPAVWKVLPDLKPSARGELEITDAIQMLVDNGGKVLGEVHHGWWHDTGTLDFFLLANSFWLDKAGIVDGIIGEGAIKDNCTLESHSAIGPGAEVRNGTVANSIVLPDVRVNLNGGAVRCCLIGKDLELLPGQNLQHKIVG